ncbi:attachment p12 family protein [Dyadobacter jejuensis]|uniref:Attachment p12 family protein n=1 Tax=Dyadobacter jejuensis TaxID=1082580 RepID=A0A316ALS0_9BACT|nr:FeoB-associated Cys-rich membrane protein [Dyadobacter jejuensis]PWJ58199.1 attachment p12 family protein [Dyadobacter jejuensis]
MDSQSIIVLVLFAAAVGFMGWRLYKALSIEQGSGCGKGCGCSPQKGSIKKA